MHKEYMRFMQGREHLRNQGVFEDDWKEVFVDGVKETTCRMLGGNAFSGSMIIVASLAGLSLGAFGAPKEQLPRPLMASCSAPKTPTGSAIANAFPVGLMNFRINQFSQEFNSEGLQGQQACMFIDIALALMGLQEWKSIRGWQGEVVSDDGAPESIVHKALQWGTSMFTEYEHVMAKVSGLQDVVYVPQPSSAAVILCVTGFLLVSGMFLLFSWSGSCCFAVSCWGHPGTLRRYRKPQHFKNSPLSTRSRLLLQLGFL